MCLQVTAGDVFNQPPNFFLGDEGFYFIFGVSHDTLVRFLFLLVSRVPLFSIVSSVKGSLSVVLIYLPSLATKKWT